MYRNALIIAALALAAGVGIAQTSGEQTFTGEIMDSTCARAGSHTAMEQEHHLGDNPRACTLACIRAGAKYVLYIPATKTIYALDNQKTPESMAGEKVKVNGRLNSVTDTIHVTAISPF